MKRLSYLLFLLLPILSCSLKRVNINEDCTLCCKSSDPLCFSGKEFEGVVLRCDSLQKLFGEVVYPEFRNKNCWEPSKKEIFQFESKFQKYFKDNFLSEKLNDKLLESYTRQYIGLDSTNEKEVLFVIFTNHPDKVRFNQYYRNTYFKAPYRIDDGGDKQFVVYYDFVSKSFFDFKVNAKG